MVSACTVLHSGAIYPLDPFDFGRGEGSWEYSGDFWIGLIKALYADE